MSRQIVGWIAVAFLGLSVVTKAPGAAPPVEPRLTDEDRRLLYGLVKEFLFDPTGAQWVVCPALPGNSQRMGWWKTTNPNRTANVYFTDGETIELPLRGIEPTDFVTFCKEFMRSKGKRMKGWVINWGEVADGELFVRSSSVEERSLVLAAWLYRLGQEALAAKLLARVPDRRKVLRGLRLELAESAYGNLLYGLTRRADKEALAAGERLLRLYSNEAAQWHSQGRAIVEDLKRRKRKGTFGRKVAKLPDMLDGWEVKKKIIYLIDALEEVDERYWHKNAGFSLESDPRVAALIAIGEPAIPALIGVVEKDSRLTRRLRFTEGPLRPQSILPVREVALVTVESILRFETPLTYFTRASFANGNEESAREVARQLWAYWNPYSKLPFDERMMKMLADPTLKAKCWREAALNLARLGKKEQSFGATMYNGIALPEIDRKKPNPATSKFRKPTVAEAILSALDQEMKTIDSKDREGVSEYDFRQVAFPYLEALYELGDGRIAAELAKRSRTSKGRMRWALAFICHGLQEPGPLATFAKEFERGKTKLPAGEEEEKELREIVKYLTAAGTREADRALYALADRKHPAYNVARGAILTKQPDPFLGEVWFRHPYCLTILRQALEDTTPTRSTFKVEGKMVRCYERQNVLAGGSWSSSEQIPGIIDYPSERKTVANERVCDVAAMRLETLVLGIASYHPLLKESDKRLSEIKTFLDRYKGRFQRVKGDTAGLFKFDP